MEDNMEDHENNLKDNQDHSDNSLKSDVPEDKEIADQKRNKSSEDEDEDEAAVNEKQEGNKENEDKVEEEKNLGDGETTKRRPEDVLNEIKRQDTHFLFCCVCKSNITTKTELFPKDQEPEPYKTKPYVLWIPLLQIPSFLIPSFIRNLLEPDTNSPEPGKNSTEPGTNAPKPDTNAPKPGTNSTDPGTNSTEPGTNASKPGTDSPELGTNSTERGTNSTEPDTNSTGPQSPEPGLWEKLKKVFLNWLLFLRFILVAILILIPVIVLLLAQKHDEEDPSPSPPTQIYIKYLPVIASFFLALLAVTWRFIPLPFPNILYNYIVVPVQNLDIVKSIVYGGLIESITSLGVVSCAAGSGTSTLNVLALAIANLFTGLILIIHKLHGLITNRPRSNSAHNESVTNSQGEDLYKEMLGNKDKRKLHCVVVVVSFIFFGLIPPVFYGLSFKRTDERLYKVAIVLAASVGCVMSLSLAKAYVFDIKKRYIVPVYTGMAIVASVLSFIASQFLNNLLAKYDFHELASDYSKG